MKTITSCLVLCLLLAAACGAHGASGKRDLLQYGGGMSMPLGTAATPEMMATPDMAPMVMTPAPAPAPMMDMGETGVTTAGRKLLADTM